MAPGLPSNTIVKKPTFVRQYGPKLLYTAIGFIAGLACFITSSYKGYGVEFDILSYLLNHRLYELIAYDFFDFAQKAAQELAPDFQSRAAAPPYHAIGLAFYPYPISADVHGQGHSVRSVLS